MYKKQFTKKRSSRSFSRGSSASRKFSTGSKYGKRSGKGKRGGGQYIDPALFINKNVVAGEEKVFVPENKFTDFDIVESLKGNVVCKGFLNPTPIQDQTIPHVLREKDVVGIANTGTGKTAAFLIPLINKVVRNRNHQVLVIVPTRELALQINEELKELSKNMRIFGVCVVGGAPMGAQIRALRYKNDFIIGTPGRLKDLIERKHIQLSKFSTLVLDEADRMLDMGFVNDMRYVVRGMPASRHTLFFSATISKEVESLISEFLNEPVRISVKEGDTSKNVEQDIVRVNKGSVKIDVLHDLLIQKEFNKVLVFGRTKHGVESLSKVLVERGFKAESIHGNKNHSQRQRALKSFKENNVQILVATDVAARGLDISNVSHVINYDIPTSYEDYVHRIGRTGRGLNKGKALTFID